MFSHLGEESAVLSAGCSEQLNAAGAEGDWRRPRVAKTPEQLAVLIERAQSRTAGMLFTATPTEDLDGISSWAQLADLAMAGSWRAITASHNRAGRGEREFLGDEVGLALGTHPGRGSREHALALSACALPGLVEAVEDGTFTQWHVRAVVRELDAVPALSLEQRQAVVLILLARFTGQDDLRLGKDTARLIASLDPVAAAARKQAADARRQVNSWAEGDGQAALLLRGPAERIAEAKAALAATAAELKAEGSDERTTDQRMFDAAIELLTGGRSGPGAWHVSVLVPFSTSTGGDLELADIPGFGAVLPSTARELIAEADSLRRLVVDAETGQLIAVDDAVPGPGRHRQSAKDRGPEATDTAAETDADTEPADPEATDTGAEARDRAASRPAAAKPAPTEPDATEPAASAPVGHEPEVEVKLDDEVLAALRAMATDPVIYRDLSTAKYRMPGRLRRHVEARDRSCVFPGCHRPASQTDKDHAIPWPVGPTHPDNVNCLCRRHHRAKQALFRVHRLPNGTIRWTTRGGQYYDRPPQGF